MSNYQVEPAARPQALSKEAIKALRKEQVQGVSAPKGPAHGPRAWAWRCS